MPLSSHTPLTNYDNVCWWGRKLMLGKLGTHGFLYLFPDILGNRHPVHLRQFHVVKGHCKPMFELETCLYFSIGGTAR